MTCSTAASANSSQAPSWSASSPTRTAAVSVASELVPAGLAGGKTEEMPHEPTQRDPRERHGVVEQVQLERAPSFGLWAFHAVTRDALQHKPRSDEFWVARDQRPEEQGALHDPQVRAGVSEPDLVVTRREAFPERHGQPRKSFHKPVGNGGHGGKDSGQQPPVMRSRGPRT